MAHAPRVVVYSAAVLLAAVLAGCAARRSPSEERLSAAWTGVQERFDRLAKFEFDFRAAAAEAVRKSDTEKLEFVRDALAQRSRLMIDLQRQVREFAATAASEPQSARVAKIEKYQAEMDKLSAIQKGTIPSLKALALEKYQEQLKGYQAQFDAELRSAK